MVMPGTDSGAQQTDGGLQVDVRVWAVLDSIFFDAATKQIELYEQHRADPSAAEQSIRYWEVAFSGTAIMMVCAAMEGHVNFLLRRAVDTPHYYQNALGVTGTDVDAFERLPVEAKWILADLILTGARHLDRGDAPFRQFCETARRRNRIVAHPKMKGVVVPAPTGQFEDLSESSVVMGLRELAELTVSSARDAVESARATVRVVYDAMGKPLPQWAR